MSEGDDTAQGAAPEAGLWLCDARALQERGQAWGWDLLEYRRPARAFALRFDGQVRAYLNRCVHVPTEMDWQPGDFFDIEKRWILCSIHGAAYEPSDGRCVGGPCGRGRLTPVRVEERDGQVYWYPSSTLQPAPAAGAPSPPALFAAPAPESPP